MTDQAVTHEAQETPMTIDEAYGIVGIGIGAAAIEVLEKFKETYMQAKAGHILVRCDDIIMAKNIAMRSIVCDQMEKQRYFEVISPFDQTCIKCHGAGEIYKFVPKTVDVTCHICAGKGKVAHPDCPTCEGSGRFVKRWPEGGGMNLKCRRCDGGTKKVYIKCRKCRGDGILKKTVLTHELKSTTPCKVCRELGFIDQVDAPIVNIVTKEKRKYTASKIGTPVLSHAEAVNLTQMIQQQAVSE